MKKEFIPYEEALSLKELGFDKPCFAGYDNEKVLYYPAGNKNSTTTPRTYKTYQYSLLTPLWQQAFIWFEEEYSLFIDRVIETSGNEILNVTYFIKSWRILFPYEIDFEAPYDSFDKCKANLICLIELIKIARDLQKSE